MELLVVKAMVQLRATPNHDKERVWELAREVRRWYPWADSVSDAVRSLLSLSMFKLIGI